MKQEIYFDYCFMDLNTYINAERGNRYAGANIKKHDTDLAMMVTKSYLNAKKLVKHTKPVHVKFTWYCKNKKKDPDNVCFARKFILDGIVKAGLLKNDGANQIIGFQDCFVYGKGTGVLVELEEI